MCFTQYIYWVLKPHHLNLPTMMRPYLLLVMPTLSWCSSVRKPRFSSNHPRSAWTCLGLAISLIGNERTVERITIPYSSPEKLEHTAIYTMSYVYLTIIKSLSSYSATATSLQTSPWLSVIDATLIFRHASHIILPIRFFCAEYGVRTAIWLVPTLCCLLRTLAISTCSDELMIAYKSHQLKMY